MTLNCSSRYLLLPGVGGGAAFLWKLLSPSGSCWLLNVSEEADRAERAVNAFLVLCSALGWSI